MYEALQYAIQQADLPQPALTASDEIIKVSSSPESNGTESSYAEQDDEHDLDGHFAYLLLATG
jgi:hypothetical protein